jgi:hypothetical protein
MLRIDVMMSGQRGMDDDGDDAAGPARAPALVPQKHGGALMPAWPPGRKGGNGSGSGWKSTRKAALALLHEATPDAALRLLELARSEDERVAAVAITQIMDRTLGRPSEIPQGADDGDRSLDLTRLTMAERAELLGALATVRRLRDQAISRDRSAAIDAEVE